MPAKHLEASVRQEPGGAVLDLHDEINRFAQEALDAPYTEAEAREPEAILLNFEGVDYINSMGIALIVGLLARARLEAPPPGLRSLGALRRDLRITRLSDFVGVFPDEESALKEALVC